MADASQVRNQASQANGVNPSTGARTVVTPSPADGVVPSALTSDPNAAAEVPAKKNTRGLN